MPINRFTTECIGGLVTH